MKWLIQPTKVEEGKIKELINILEKSSIDYDLVYPFENKVVKQDKTLYHYDDVYSKNDVINCHEDVIIAAVKKINKEHRFFIVDGKIATASLYKINGSISTSDVIDEGAKIFVENMIKKFDFPGFVIDVATIGNEYKIVELNCLNASGFYEINLYKLIDSVERYYSK